MRHLMLIPTLALISTAIYINHTMCCSWQLFAVALVGVYASAGIYGWLLSRSSTPYDPTADNEPHKMD